MWQFWYPTRMLHLFCPVSSPFVKSYFGREFSWFLQQSFKLEMKNLFFGNLSGKNHPDWSLIKTLIYCFCWVFQAFFCSNFLLKGLLSWPNYSARSQWQSWTPKKYFFENSQEWGHLNKQVIWAFFKSSTPVLYRWPGCLISSLCFRLFWRQLCCWCDWGQEILHIQTSKTKYYWITL